MRHLLLPALLSLSILGCGPGWHPVELTPAAAPAAQTQFLVHHGGAVERWHAVRVAADTLSGIPWLASIDCDSCRVSLPRLAIDAISEGHPTAGFWKGFGLVTGSILALCGFTCPRGD